MVGFVGRQTPRRGTNPSFAKDMPTGRFNLELSFAGVPKTIEFWELV